jgi:hypothetical protein
LSAPGCWHKFSAWAAFATTGIRLPHRQPRRRLLPPPSRLLAAFDLVVQVAAIGAMAVGIVVVARWFDGLARPAPGWVCWQIARVTAEGTQRDRRCELADGWHAERRPDGATVAVPDNAPVVRQHAVRD